jgi:hypothetical protein
MTTATARKYDPFQATLLAPHSSTVPDPTEKSGDHTPETARHYGESYLYAPRKPNAQLHHMASIKVASTATAIGEAPPMGLSATIEGNVIHATSEQPVPPSVFFRKSVYSQPLTRFEVLQKWEGIVLDVLKDSFTARLIDLTQEGSDEEAEFALEEIDEGDKGLLKPGAVFYWNIGYSDSPSGRARVSIIRFRRLPVWRSEELERAKRDAERLSGLLEWK